MRWCLRGRMTCQSCRKMTQRGSPKYVCDHLWIWLVKVLKMIRQKTKHSQAYSCSRTSAGWGEGGCPQAPNSCHIGRGPTASLALIPCPWAANSPGQQAPWPPPNVPHGLQQAQTLLWAQSSLLLSGQNGNKQK